MFDSPYIQEDMEGPLDPISAYNLKIKTLVVLVCICSLKMGIQGMCKLKT